MLTLLLGRAGSGKTSKIFKELATLADKRCGGNILIVPEQYSHDAERAFAQECGAAAGMYAEVLSFSRLCSRVFAETGGLAEKTLDNGGRVLCMSLALSEVSSKLRKYNVGRRRPDFLKILIDAYDELRSSCVSSERLAEVAGSVDGSFSDKLSDLALIFEMYDAIKERSGCDTRDKLERLVSVIGESSVGSQGKIFIDGFSDFTAQEFRVIEELMKKGADITVSLTCGRLDDTDILFRIPIKTAQMLISCATKHAVNAEIINMVQQKSNKSEELRFLEKHLMDFDPDHYNGECTAISAVSAENPAEECSAAAAKCLELARKGCRWRDIAVVSPIWQNYEPIARGVFKKYNVPLNLTEKSDVLEKPVMALVTSALDIISGNWEYNDVFNYLKTGIAGIENDERDILENYVLKWSIRGENAWTRADGWHMHPGGYSENMSERESSELERINLIREKVSTPILSLHQALDSADSAIEKVRALYTFMEDIGLYGILKSKSAALRTAGERQLADEYLQLWDIIISAMQQFADIIGDTPIDSEEFIRLLKLVLSQYKVGVIPTSVDNVRAGDMTRMRARGVKHLIILGATESALSGTEKSTGVFTDSERNIMRDHGLDLLDSGDDMLSRELGAIYSAFTVPTDSLTVMFPTSSGNSRRSYIVTRIENLFGIKEMPVTPEVNTAAISPCLELAASGECEEAYAAKAYFEAHEEYSKKLDALKRAANMPRGRLNRITAERLYGKELRVSASRIDRFYSCRFSYFLQYGLKAKPRSLAALDAPEVGTFMHFVLERASREIMARGGYGKITEDDIKKIVPGYVKEYIENKLGGLENKSGRFKYLLGRLSQSVIDVIIRMAEELKNSKFVPLDFELKFASDGELAPIEISDYDGGKVLVNGIVDRVDGWINDGKLYLRVVDYKTGKKAFSLSDIWYGLGMQMLIYLFALERDGSGRYGNEIIPAGVLYAPARDIITQSDRDLDDDELEKERTKNIKRSGLLLCDPEVIAAMESPDAKDKLLPVKFAKDGTPSGDSLATLEQLGKLSCTIDRLIADMGREVRSGSISADPYFRAQLDNACVYCDYFEACRFKDGYGDDRMRYLTRLKTPDAWNKMEGGSNE